VRQAVQNEAISLLKRMKMLYIAFMPVFSHKVVQQFDATSSSLDVSTAVKLLNSVKEYINTLYEE
jgi:hypothetical protein